MAVGVCTNATTLDDRADRGTRADRWGALQRLLDGFRPESHGKFRGDRDSFPPPSPPSGALAAARLLQGLLCTPNSLAQDLEYRSSASSPSSKGADYVLMNPLSAMGRGVKAHRPDWPPTEERMRHIHEMTDPFEDAGLDVVHIRFPDLEPDPSRAAKRARLFTCSPPAR